MEGKIDAAKRLAESKGAKVYDLWTRGKSDLARLLSLCHVGDYVSVYLSAFSGVDPGPCPQYRTIEKSSDVKQARRHEVLNGNEKMVQMR